MKPVVVIPVKNRLDLTAPLVEALREQGEYSRLLVYDNGSTDGTAAFLEENGYERMDAQGWNLHQMWNDGLAIAAAMNEPCAILNNDLELDGAPNWLSRLCRPFGDGWHVVCPNYDGRISHRSVDPVHDICAGRYDGTGGLAGFAFVVSAHVANTYRFPEDLGWWFGDTDLMKTMKHRDVPCGLVIGVGVTHLDGGSQTAKDYDLQDQTDRDEALYREKWKESPKKTRKWKAVMEDGITEVPTDA